MRSARALGWAGLCALVGKFWADGLALVHAKLAPFMIGTWITALNERVVGPAWMGRTVMLSWEPMFIAAGAITGLHVGWSMLAGSVTAWMIFAPILQHRGLIEGTGYAAIVPWTLVGRRGLHGDVEPPLLRHAVADGAPRVRRSRRDGRRRSAGQERSGGRHRDAGVVVHWRAGLRPRRAGMARARHLRHALLADRGGRAAVVRARPGRMPRHRRDRHHARRRDGQDHAAHVRRPEPGQRERESHERQHHRRRGGQQRRSAHRPEERLPARRASAPAVPRAVRGHLRRARW